MHLRPYHRKYQEWMIFAAVHLRPLYVTVKHQELKIFEAMHLRPQYMTGECQSSLLYVKKKQEPGVLSLRGSTASRW